MCGIGDARLLTEVTLDDGVATLCGSHALLHTRAQSAGGATTVAELRAALTERRSYDRRAAGGGDELAERLSAAFTRERRGVESSVG